ncbi:MAG: SDR family oxidoreductase [Candidatus Cloacimonetes bacterium]|nr:SDR family oxidoreductase [Candidatus Cloacimonadota bacterium]
MKQQDTIIITGSNGNVASWFSRQLLEQGHRLVLNVHKTRDRVADLIIEYPDQVQIFEADASDEALFGTKLAQCLAIDDWHPTALIHTATIRSHDFKNLADTDSQLWRHIMDVNVIGTYNVLKAVIPYFREMHYGKIVLFASNVTRIGLPKGSAYSASKAAIANLARSLAGEEAGNGILVNTISPGPIMIDESHFSESYRKFRQEYYQEKIKEIPLQRCATFRDIFGICNFLISVDNTYITGEEFYITGGKL